MELAPQETLPTKNEVSTAQTAATITTNDPENLNQEISLVHNFDFPEKTKKLGRLMILLACIAVLIIGRNSVPNNEVHCIQDKIIDAMHSVNSFLNAHGNQHFRDFAQIFCSLLVDTTFVLTFGNWVLRGTNGRLPVTMALFYITRALVQLVWFSPFPEGYYWESPGIPSLVVPYGRGSDFFFSGHSGFMVICALEWHKLQVSKIRNFVIVSGVYTIFVLLAYRIHYSIDIFVGVFFAEWCFYKVHGNIDLIDEGWTILMKRVRSLLYPGKQIMLLSQDAIKLSRKNEDAIENVC